MSDIDFLDECTYKLKPSPRKAGFHTALTKFFTVFNGSVSQQERLVH